MRRTVIVVDQDLGFGGPGAMALGICGDDLTYDGSEATLAVTGAAANASLSLVIGLTANPIPFKGGFLAPIPLISIITGLPAHGSGNLSLPVSGGAATPIHVILQVLAKPGATFEFSNALDAEIGF